MYAIRSYYATIEALQKLRVINKDGMVTAGNASGINDGAAAIVVMSEEKAKELYQGRRSLLYVRNNFV